ncbi:MAG TPA: hypothetical protein EYP98_19680, partial [Planctomycetes bacterium]|nr:hypothetical protein [Planctomycetota bacterium]
MLDPLLKLQVATLAIQAPPIYLKEVVKRALDELFVDEDYGKIVVLITGEVVAPETPLTFNKLFKGMTGEERALVQTQLVSNHLNALFRTETSPERLHQLVEALVQGASFLLHDFSIEMQHLRRILQVAVVADAAMNSEVSEGDETALKAAREYFKDASAKAAPSTPKLSKACWVMPLGVRLMENVAVVMSAFHADRLHKVELPKLQTQVAGLPDVVKKIFKFGDQVALVALAVTPASKFPPALKKIAIRRELDMVRSNCSRSFMASHQNLILEIDGTIDAALTILFMAASHSFWFTISTAADLFAGQILSDKADKAADLASMDNLVKSPDHQFSLQMGRLSDMIQCLSKSDSASSTTKQDLEVLCTGRGRLLAKFNGGAKSWAAGDEKKLPLLEEPVATLNLAVLDLIEAGKAAQEAVGAAVLPGAAVVPGDAAEAGGAAVLPGDAAVPPEGRVPQWFQKADCTSSLALGEVLPKLELIATKLSAKAQKRLTAFANQESMRDVCHMLKAGTPAQDWTEVVMQPFTGGMEAGSIVATDSEWVRGVCNTYGTGIAAIEVDGKEPGTSAKIDIAIVKYALDVGIVMSRQAVALAGIKAYSKKQKNKQTK